MSQPNHMCMLPWMSIEVTPEGTCRPCCMALENISDDQGQSYRMTQHSVKEIYHSKYMQNLREQFRAGERPATCQRCWNEEDAGRTSKRMNMFYKFRSHEPMVDYSTNLPEHIWYVDLKLGNICNLKCRICGSWSSSKWAQEELDYLGDMPREYKRQHRAYKFLQNGQWPRTSMQFWQNMDQLLPHVKYFDFTGGEPFLIQEQFDLLQRAVDTGVSGNISVHYNTNGTQFPESAIDIWRQFKQIDIAFSIDDTGKRFEYQRYGAVWEDVDKNLDRYLQLANQYDNISLQICATVNIHNVLYIPELLPYLEAKGFDNIYINMLHDPWYFNIAHMTDQAKQLVIERLQSAPRNRFYNELQKLVNFINNGSGSNGSEFRFIVRQADEYRNLSLTDHHAEIAQAMGYKKWDE
jgi:MoaA/NifB/PqqE/SkfB family radical SAM enzyme